MDREAGKICVIDLDEDYESTCPKGFRFEPDSGHTIPVGLCNRMCSYDEMQERESNLRLHKYEMIPNTHPPRVDFKACMKMATRSSAGSEAVRCMDLRPWSVLRQGLHHLLLDICLKDDDWMFVCDFVFDRLKAIRADIIIQRIEGRRYVEILEGSVRFLVYSMYRLTSTLKDYTDVIDPTKVVIPLQGPVTGLNSFELNVISEMKMTMKCLRDCLNSLIIQYQENCPDSPFRPLFEAINLIVNLPFMPLRNSCETQFQACKKLRNKFPMFKTVFKMYIEHLTGNHLTALKYLPLLIDYPILLMAYAPAIAQLQIDLIRIFKFAYEKGINTCSIDRLTSLICPDHLESNPEERQMFARLAAVQFQIYDTEKDICNFRLNAFGSQKQTDSVFNRNEGKKESDNETRIFALQMVFGKDWQIYRDSIDLVGLKAVLDPTQPSKQPDFDVKGVSE